MQPLQQPPQSTNCTQALAERLEQSRSPERTPGSGAAPLTEQQRRAIVAYKTDQRTQRALLDVGHDAVSFYRYPQLTSAYNELRLRDTQDEEAFLEVARSCPKRNVEPDKLVPHWLDKMLDDTRSSTNPPAVASRRNSCS